MKKVFLVLLALSLSFMFVSCSEDENTVAPTPEPDTLEITTGATLVPGITSPCSSYSVELEAEGGTEPYTWTLAAGSTLPTGLDLSSDGTITGIIESSGNYNFSIVCTDNGNTTDEVEFSLIVNAFGISTNAILTSGQTCSPYSMQLEAMYGIEPYTWTLATGSTLPTGLELSSEGIITGVMESDGNYNFSIICTDDCGTTTTDEVAFSLGIEVPANPSIAVFFDEGASVCCGDITYPATLDCYAYIMLDGNIATHARGASFKLNLLDSEGDPLVYGEHYIYTATTYPIHVPVSIGDINGGLAVGFDRAMPYTAPIGICSFSLMLFESFDEMSFEIVRNPREPGVTEPIFLDGDYDTHDVIGRRAAINY